MSGINMVKLCVNALFPAPVFKRVRRAYRKMRRYAAMIRYHGNAVLCPCCAGRFSKFADFALMENYQKNALYAKTCQNTVCPGCSSLPRHRIIAWHLEQNRRTIPTDAILMFGADPVAVWLENNALRYAAVDLSDRYADLNMDIQALRFPDGAWSLIICNHVLEHVQDYGQALRELRRVLADDGVLLLTVPADRSLATTYEDAAIVTEDERREAFGQSDHLRVFGGDVAAILAASGFAAEIVEGGALPDAIVPVTGPAHYDDNRVYVCKKIPTIPAHIP